MEKKSFEERLNELLKLARKKHFTEDSKIYTDEQHSKAYDDCKSARDTLVSKVEGMEKGLEDILDALELSNMFPVMQNLIKKLLSDKREATK